MAIYGPNKNKPSFYQQLSDKLKNIENSSVILCGDWNIVMDYNIDMKGYLHLNNPKARESLLQMMESLELYDVWRERNEDIQKYTWFKNKKQIARLDYFWSLQTG